MKIFSVPDNNPISGERVAKLKRIIFKKRGEVTAGDCHQYYVFLITGGVLYEGKFTKAQAIFFSSSNMRNT